MRLNACIEDLNEMTPTESGRFCSSCNKNIVDLTEKSNEEIQQLYIENNGELCGIVLPNQLDERKFYHPLKRFAFALMLVFGSALFVFGGDIKPHFDTFRMRVLTEVSDVDVAYTIKGFVFGNGNAINNAQVSVVIDDKLYSANSGTNGEFTLELPNLKITDVTIIVSADGFTNVTRNVALVSSSVFIGKVSLELDKIEKCVKGKIAPEPIRTAGAIAMPERPQPQEIKTQGEVAPTSGGIEKPKEDSIFD